MALSPEQALSEARDTRDTGVERDVASSLSSGSDPSSRERDDGEVIAAAIVRVASSGRAGADAPGRVPQQRVGVVLQTVSAVTWLSAGRARGAA